MSLRIEQASGPAAFAAILLSGALILGYITFTIANMLAEA
jgi:hypothetical protein